MWRLAALPAAGRAEPDDPRGPFQPKPFYDSMIGSSDMLDTAQPAIRGSVKHKLHSVTEEQLHSSSFGMSETKAGPSSDFAGV